MVDYKNKSYLELVRELDRLNAKYDEIESDCIKEGLSYSEFREKAHDVSEERYFVNKYKRLKQDPTIEYGKEWNGELFPIEKFKSMCLSGFFADNDGAGYYATESAKSDINIFPSDVIENIMRTDFTHVIWFNK